MPLGLIFCYRMQRHSYIFKSAKIFFVFHTSLCNVSCAKTVVVMPTVVSFFLFSQSWASVRCPSLRYDSGTLETNAVLMGSSALWELGYSMSSWASLAGVLLRRNRMLEKRDEAVRATRLRPTFRQCTSDVTGTSAKRALSRDTRMMLSLFSMSLTIFKISCLSVCRVIPRILSMAETCFLLKTQERPIHSWLMCKA